MFCWYKLFGRSEKENKKQTPHPVTSGQSYTLRLQYPTQTYLQINVAQKTPKHVHDYDHLPNFQALSKNMLELVHGEQPTNSGQQTKYLLLDKFQSKEWIMSLSVFFQTGVFQEPECSGDGVMLESNIVKECQDKTSFHFSRSPTLCRVLSDFIITVVLYDKLSFLIRWILTENGQPLQTLISASTKPGS